MNDNYLLAGEPLESQAGALFTTGAAWVLDPSSGDVRYKIVPPYLRRNDVFGWSVALDGDVAVIGAPSIQHECCDIGRAFVYNLATGEQLAILTPDDGQRYDDFGYSVALTDKYAVIGSPGNNTFGAAYIFERETWTQIAKIVPPDASNSAQFGRSIAVSEDSMVIGAPFFDQDGINDQGAAFLFDLNSLEQEFRLTMPNPRGSELLGFSVGLLGEQVLVGALNDSLAGERSGAVYLFDVHSGDFIETLIPNGVGAKYQLGSAIASDGRFAIIGAPFAAPPQDSPLGSAYVLQLVPEPNSLFLGLLALFWPSIGFVLPYLRACTRV